MRLSIALLLALWAMPAVAAECSSGNSSFLKVQDVQLKTSSSGVLGAISYVSSAEKIIKLAHVLIQFDDVLGEHIGSIATPIDESIIPKVPGQLHFSSGSVDRLKSIRTENLSTLICVKDVLYVDGEKQSFD